MKKIISMLSAITLLISATGCNKDTKKPEELSDSTQNITAQTGKNEITSYSAQKLALPAEGDFFNGVIQLEDDRYLVTTSDNFRIYYFETDGDFSQYNAVSPELPEQCPEDSINTFNFLPQKDGSVIAVVTSVTHGGLKAPDEYDENFDYQAYEEASYKEIFLIHYDRNFKITSCTQMDSLTDFVNKSHNNYIFSVSPLLQWDEDTFLVSTTDNELLLFDKNSGKQTGKVDTGSAEFENMSIMADRDGELIAFVGTENELKLHQFNTEKKALEGEGIALPQEQWNGRLKGAGDYRFFIGKQDGLYGFTDNSQLVLVMDWLESCIDFNRANVSLAREDGSFLVSSINDETKKSELNRYTEAVSGNISEIEKITVGYMGDHNEFSKELSTFNQTFENYAVSGEKITSEEQLRLDMISGSAPDVIIHNNFSFVQKLCDKGVFADLYEFMENDPQINRDTLMGNVLKACEADDGKLYTLPNCFEVDTLMIKSKYWDNPSMTAHELIELYNNPPVAGMKFSDGANTKMEVFMTLANYGENFVDYEKAECYFDTPQFIEVLEFCNTFPETEQMPDKFTEPEAFDNFYRDKATWLRNDMALITDISEFGYFYSYNYNKYGSFGEDVTLCGMPFGETSRPMISFFYNLTISENSQHKEPAWEFVKLCLQQEFKTDSDEVVQWYSFPVMKESFDRMAQDSQKKQGINESFLGNSIPPLTQEDCDYLMEFILTADQVKQHTYNSDVSLITDEEIQAFFAGDQTAEQTAEYIQNRVSIMLSEQS
ncbi:MAG: extracellular solute-binding protein [Ruminococcus sp.]|nr:extracellular solute-binding protein [Ruminococcus sp.]